MKPSSAPVRPFPQMPRRNTARLIPWLIAGALCAHALPALADSMEEGRARFQRAVELHQEGDLKGALAEFRRANEISPSFKILYNIGQTEAQLGNYLAAISSFEQYLSSGGTQIPPERRTEVSEELARLRMRVGKLMVQSNVDNALLSIDGVAQGRLPLTAPIAVNVGNHTVVVQDGARSRTASIEIPGGETKTVELLFSKIVPVVTTPLQPPTTRVVKNYAPMAVSFAIAGVGVAGAITFGAIAYSANQRHEDELSKSHARRYDAEAKAANVRAYSIASDVFTSAAAIATVVGVYFAIRPPTHTETTRVGIGPGSLSLTHQF